MKNQPKVNSFTSIFQIKSSKNDSQSIMCSAYYDAHLNWLQLKNIKIYKYENEQLK